MSYTITVRIIDATTGNPGFKLVEKTVWHYANGGTWSNTDSIETLVMGGSGTSGALRFINGAGEEFLVTLGIHNYKRWCDIVTDLAPGDTGMKIQPEYYSDSSARNQMLWKQLDHIQKKSAKGTSVDVKYVEEVGNSFVVHIFISC
ncbi:lectin 2b [Suillus clintonianus]|uniref:lectin 2b n=1 Tax=Suillus clintonianus TaxID=1904413 RepID=UPI001B87FCDF|nr:lectin 2b [Suillus clintonianus]KAG2124616.1 lectin 2b [Suillus clintonianus]